MPARPPSYSPPKRQQDERARKKNIDDRRGSSTQRGYDSAWQRLRKRFLRENPLCCFCMDDGKLTEATVVDHIVTISERPDMRLTWSNLRALCKRCHDRRTAKDQGFARVLPKN